MFIYPALLWFLPLLALVVLVHLINMFRHRRVEWAALEFLLAGYRKSRMRILFQQLLLMLLRILAVASVILMLAGPRLEGRLADWFGGRSTHHIVLLDDSWSMNDRNTALGGTPAFEDALTVLRQIAEGASRRKAADRISLVRLSRAGAVEKGEEPDLADILPDAEGMRIIGELLRNLAPSAFAGEPDELLAAAASLIRQSGARLKPAVYLISDFRQRNWENPTPVLKRLEEIRELGGTVRMVRTVNEQRGNLGIESLEPVDGIHAADIDLLVDANVVNHGDEDVENVNVMLMVDGVSRSNRTIARLKAGQRTLPPVRFPVRLESGRPRRLEVQIQPDALAEDNRRYLVLEVPEALEVLIVAPETAAKGTEATARYLRVALSPGGAKSGVRIRVEPPGFLVSNPLTPFSAVFLLDIPAMEPASVNALEDYVRDGGGVAFFLGPDGDLGFIRNELYKNGHGIFPVAPIAETPLEPDFLSRNADVNAFDHPVFRLFGEGESPLLGNIKVERYVAVEPTSAPMPDLPPENAVKPPAVLATLRTGAPLVLEKEFGRGRTVTFLTTAAPLWNNWARGNPSFVVVMLELTAWLSKRPGDDAAIRIGEPLAIRLDPAQFETGVKLLAPSKEDAGEGVTASLDAVQTGDGNAAATFTRTDRPGFYEAELKDRSGNAVERYFAVNVDAREGETRLADTGELAELLKPFSAVLETAAGFSTSSDFSGRRPLSDALLFIVVLLLIGEIFLAGRILPPIGR